jgi:hypothetical protein
MRKAPLLLLLLLLAFLPQPARCDLMSFAGVSMNRFHANNCNPGSVWGTTSASYYMHACSDIGPDVPVGPPWSDGGFISVSTGYATRSLSLFGGGPMDSLSIDGISSFSEILSTSQTGLGYLSFLFSYDSTLLCSFSQRPCDSLLVPPTLTLSLNQSYVDIPLSGTGQVLLTTGIVDFAKPIAISSDLTVHYAGHTDIDFQSTVTLLDVSPPVSPIPEPSAWSLLLALIAAIRWICGSKWTRIW